MMVPFKKILALRIFDYAVFVSGIPYKGGKMSSLCMQMQGFAYAMTICRFGLPSLACWLRF